MSISNVGGRKVLAGLVAAALAVASTGASAQDRYDHSRYDDPRYEDGRYDNDGAYDYAKVIDVQPLTSRVRVSTPQQECWDETRYESRREPMPNSVAGGTLLGAVIGAAIGNQIGSGDGRRVATAGGAVIGAAIGHNTAMRRGGYGPSPPREYTAQRCETRYHDEYQERVDGYRVTYLYHGRRQVTEMPYRPGDRIRVRVDVSPAE
jgi:uncharacterized protein YcfJ